MAKRSVDDLYREGRTRPRNNLGYTDASGDTQPVRRSPVMETASARDTAHNYQGNQDPSDYHDKKYSNDTSGWVHGEGEDATTKPGFDRGNSWRLKDGGLNQHSGHDEARIRKPEKNVP